MAFGAALKGVQLILRSIEFCCAAIVFSISCYYLATLHNHSLHIATYLRAVTGISGVAVIYTALGLLLVCCLGGVTFLSLVAILLDLAFTGAFVYTAWAYRGGAGSCKGNVNTPFGSGNTNSDNAVPTGKGGFTHLPTLRHACQIESAAFAVAVIAAVFFFLSLFVEIGLIRHHKREKAFGPSPNNGYTAGSPRRKFWQRKRVRDAELADKRHPDALPTHATPADVRTSYQTDTTAVAGEQPVYNKYGNDALPASHRHSNTPYETAPAAQYPSTAAYEDAAPHHANAGYQSGVPQQTYGHTTTTTNTTGAF